jgi:dipeptidyl aminopeptidase/acylaminoacyl peptidase
MTKDVCLKPTLILPLLLAILLSACGAGTALPQTAQPTLALPASSATGVPATAAPTQAESTPSLTPLAIPAGFGSDNFQQFVRVQTYRTSIEAATGRKLSDMRLDVVAYSLDGRFVAVGGCTSQKIGDCFGPDVAANASFLFILNARTAGIVATLPETQATVTGLAFSSDGEKLVYAVNPDRIVLWGVASGRVEKVLWQGSGSAYRRVAVSPDGGRIAEVDSHTLRVWDVASGKVLTQKPGGNFGDDLPRFSADGNRLAVFSLDSGLEISVYDTLAWEKVALFALPGEDPGPVALTRDFKLLATAQGSGSTDVLLWDVASGKQLAGLEDPTLSSVTAVGFTPDGQLLLVSGEPSDDTDIVHPFRVWDVASRQQLGRMAGSSSSVSRILFSKDGTSFLTGVSLWSLPDENVLAVRQALLDFTSALNRGDYNTAAGLYQPYVDDATYFNSLGVEATDVPALLAFVCAQDSKPCMPVREILYAGKEFLGDYGLLVRFTGPDGSIYTDADGFDMFWLYADIDTGGKVTFSSLPPFPRTP